MFSVELKSIFRLIPLAAPVVQSCGMFSESTDIGHDMRASNCNLRYAGSLVLFKHVCLMRISEKPAFPGHEDVAPAPIEAAHVNVIAADVATAYTSYHDSWTDHVPMSAFPDQSHPFPPVDESPNVQVSPTLGTQKSFSTSVEHEASSPLSEEELEKPYKCSYPGCGKRFQVPQSVGRHYRKNHDPNTCMYSNDGCDFRWGGPYDYRRHLNVTHELENEVINAILGKRADSYDRATIVGRKPFTPSLYITN